MSENKNVVIIGGGVIGCSIAYHLGKKGITSLILERESIGARASGKAWGMFTYPPLHLVGEKVKGNLMYMPPGESTANFLDIYWSGYYRMAEIAQDIKEIGGMDIEYSENEWTHIVYTLDEEQLFKTLSSFLKSQGFVGFEWIPASELRRIFPNIDPSVRGGVNCPEHQVETYKYTLGLAQAAEKMGAEVKQGEAVGFGTKGDKITSVKLASGAEIKADKVVIAMGPWSGQGSSWLGKRIPIQLNMEECLRLEGPKNYPLHTIHAEVVITPKVNGNIILGRTAFPDLKDDFDARLSEEQKTFLLDGAMKTMPDLEEAKVIEHRGDLQAWAPGPAYHKPVLGPLPGWENCYVATRFGTTGIQASPGAGKFMADLIAGGKVPHRLRRLFDYLSPARAL
jgi:glycine oxidase